MRVPEDPQVMARRRRRARFLWNSRKRIGIESEGNISDRINTSWRDVEVPSLRKTADGPGVDPINHPCACFRCDKTGGSHDLIKALVEFLLTGPAVTTPRLPPELVLRILDFLGEDRQTIRACALISKEWAVFARPRGCERLALLKPSRRFLSNGAIQMPKSLQACIRDVEIFVPAPRPDRNMADRDSYAMTLCNWLGMLRQLRTLKLKHVPFVENRDVEQFTCSVFLFALLFIGRSESNRSLEHISISAESNTAPLCLFNAFHGWFWELRSDNLSVFELRHVELCHLSSMLRALFKNCRSLRKLILVRVESYITTDEPLEDGEAGRLECLEHLELRGCLITSLALPAIAHAQPSLLTLKLAARLFTWKAMLTRSQESLLACLNAAKHLTLAGDVPELFYRRLRPGNLTVRLPVDDYDALDVITDHSSCAPLTVPVFVKPCRESWRLESECGLAISKRLSKCLGEIKTLAGSKLIYVKRTDEDDQF